MRFGWDVWASGTDQEIARIALLRDGQNPAPNSNHGKPLFVGIYKGIIIPWFLRWCRIASIHSMDCSEAHTLIPATPTGILTLYT